MTVLVPTPTILAVGGRRDGFDECPLGMREGHCDGFGTDIDKYVTTVGG